MNKRHSYATRSMSLMNRAISNVLVLGGELNVVQLESDPVSISARTARALREVKFDALQREVDRVRALKRQKKTWMIMSNEMK